eukprot:69038-Chlamydomonas_euryale.AAC.1
MSLKGLRVLKLTVPRAALAVRDTESQARDAGSPSGVSAPSGQNGRCVTLSPRRDTGCPSRVSACLN